ncbi:MAG: M56 family metallopeptidase [Planctomycetota bacterium]|jgi:beta-lactamase regulating signal transducer with metallopeptidase domain
MTDFLFQMAISNAVFALALAILAMVVGRASKRPYLAHMLWLLVFVKLVTPPVVTIPVGMPSLQPDMIASTPVVLEFDIETQPATIETAQAPPLLSSIGAKLNAAKPLATFIWLLGSVSVFAWSLHRVFRFTRLLKENTEPAPYQLQTTAATIAKQLELNTLPAILTTSARLSPMVWWAGGKVHVVIPSSLLDEMDASEWRWVLAHELAHVRRLDYLVRWP